uniref:Tc1-like transposase DDE domain-containing protein n=1 Tax=Acrobeloides nanus TaxID=290746 RepID=A0A914CJX3_9BILA
MWFAGEATFYTNGRVECHNLVYLAEDPDEPESKSAPPATGSCITVWAAFNSRTILGPYIASGHADKKTYELFLKKFNYEFRQLQRLEFKLYDPIFMHDDSPLHKDSQEFLNDKFPEAWVGPGANYATWPKLSPDIHPLCFFLWGYIKSKVYEKPIAPDGINELSLRIQQAFMEIIPEMLKAASKAYKDRLRAVVENDGNLVDVHNNYENEPIQTEIEAMSWMSD